MSYYKYEVYKEYTQQALAFDPVLIPDGIPVPMVKDENGNIFLQVKAPDAKSVFFMMEDNKYECNRCSDGIWRVEYPFTGGFHYVHLNIDGAEVLTPYLPIGYGYSRPCNYISTPDNNDDWYNIHDVEHGVMFREYFLSNVTGEIQSCMVYLPADYWKNPEKKFPVLYLQHGHGENEIGWGTAGKLPIILDNLIAKGKSVPFAVVMNNGMVQVKDNGRRIVDFLKFDQYLINDVIPHMENKYHIGGSKEYRGMAGLSMGSLQTSISGFSHPELFSAIGIFSGFMHDWIQGSELDMVKRGKSDDIHLELLQNRERFNREYNLFFRAIGDKDPFIDYFYGDDERCEKAGIIQIRKIYSGGHDWNVWRQCIRDFSTLVFQ